VHSDVPEKGKIHTKKKKSKAHVDRKRRRPRVSTIVSKRLGKGEQMSIQEGVEEGEQEGEQEGGQGEQMSKKCCDLHGCANRTQLLLLRFVSHARLSR
jgi:hypothetical protein